MSGKIGAPRTESGRENRAAILDFISSYRHEHGYFPVREEICKATGLSVGAFTWHITSLASQGFLEYQPGRFARTLKLTRKQRRFLE